MVAEQECRRAARRLIQESVAWLDSFLEEFREQTESFFRHNEIEDHMNWRV